MPTTRVPILAAVSLLASLQPIAWSQGGTWRYYRPGNTGIQGDTLEALYVGADGDPWIGAYDPAFEEGGVAKFVQAENRWINVSNVDHPAFGHPNDTGSSRVSDIVEDAQGRLWLGTWRGAVRFDPQVGPASLVRFGTHNSTLPGGRTVDVAVAPGGAVVFSADSTVWGGGGLSMYEPATNAWSFLGAYGGRIATQPRPGGGFYLWASIGGSFGGAARWDSVSQLWTSYPLTAGNPRELISKDSADDAGNVWMMRSVNGFDTVLDCLRPDGTWVAPPLPALPPGPVQIAAVRGFGALQALLVDGLGILHRFNGSSWANLGPVPQISPYVEDLDIDASGNVWLTGANGGVARRDAATGVWQRYRMTNTANFDTFNGDITIDPVNGHVYATANAAPGVGGMVRFDGERWTGWNQLTYGLGFDWPFPNDNSHALAYRPSSGKIAVSPTNWIYGVHEWTGAGFQQIAGIDGAQELCEDSLGRLWALGEYFSLRYHDGASWTSVPIIGWGARMHRDPALAGTVWAATSHEVRRTDGAVEFRRTIDDFPPLSSFSDTFSGLAVGLDGTAWIGAGTQGAGGSLIHIDPVTGTHQVLRHALGWPFPGEQVQPLAVSPDGRVWLQYSSSTPSGAVGLCWYDGVNVGIYPAPPTGAPQWGGLPNALIDDIEVRVLQAGYELWISCISRGIAVLTINEQPVGTVFCTGDNPAVPCPCGNSSGTSARAGCANSTGSGAELRALGSASIGADALILRASHLPPGASGLVFMGGSTIPAATLGDGHRCIGAPLFRFDVRNSGATGTFSYGPGQLAWIGANLPATAGVTSGASWRFQAWFRDPAGPCGSGVNTSNAVLVTFGP